MPNRGEVAAQQDLAKPVDVVALVEGLAKTDAELLELIGNHGKELAAIEECQAKESEEVKARLVAFEGDSCDCGCNGECGAKLAALEARVAAMESKPMYPAVSGVKSGGSTGSLGSTGSAVGLSNPMASKAVPVQSSFGSAGSAAGSVGRAPIKAMAKVVTSPIARAGHWTYPGEIGNHLASDHGVATAGMSREQQLDLHDSIHEGQSPQMPMVKRLPMAGSCPGGNCPASRTQSSGWYLGRAFRR